MQDSTKIQIVYNFSPNIGKKNLAVEAVPEAQEGGLMRIEDKPDYESRIWHSNSMYFMIKVYIAQTQAFPFPTTFS